MSVRALYRLFIASLLLRNIKIPYKGTAHDYPKMQLSYLLLLEYWRVNKCVPWTMMKGNMNVFNEEYGEISFSILARCVLGDHIKSKFDHTRRLYRMLPAYRSVKQDILEDQKSSGSISWRRVIAVDSDEVTVTKIFFQNVIKQIFNT